MIDHSHFSDYVLVEKVIAMLVGAILGFRAVCDNMSYLTLICLINIGIINYFNCTVAGFEEIFLYLEEDMETATNLRT